VNLEPFIKYMHLLPEKLRMLYDNSWKIKHHVRHILSRLFPKYYEQGITMETTDTVVPAIKLHHTILKTYWISSLSIFWLGGSAMLCFTNQILLFILICLDLLTIVKSGNLIVSLNLESAYGRICKFLSVLNLCT
jgi:hypothetical protein